MSEVKKVPEIRFAGFTEPWEQRQLEEYLSVSTEKNTSDVYGKEDVLSVSGDYGIVNQIEFQGRSFAGASVSNYGVVYTGDIVYTKSPLSSNPYGIIKTNKGKPGIVSTLYAVYHSKKNTCSDFVQTYFEQHSRMNNYMHPLVNKGAKNDMKVSAENALKGLVTFPKYEEQKTISDFFSSLDNLLTLYQRKLDRLVVLKQAMLEKMFPQGGSNVPEVRFTGFTDPWEQRKFGDDLISIQTGTNKLGSENGKGTPLLKMGNIQRGYFSLDKIEYLSDGDDVEPENIAYYGDFFFNTRNTLELVGKGATWTGNSGEYAFNSNIARFKLRELDTIFFNYLYNTRSMIEQVHARAMGTTSVAAIYPQSLKSIEYYVPTMAEQQRIGELLLKIDNLITLHHRKHESLKHIKAALLQKMFV